MTTGKKDLHDGRSVWYAYGLPRIPHTALEKDATYDCVIIGAGITGAILAQTLSETGLSIILLDRRRPLHGSTQVTTALLQYEIDVPVSALTRKIGYDKAARAWRRSRVSLDNLARKTRLLGIACNLKDQNSLYLDGNILSPRALEEEGRIRNRLGFFTRYLKRADLYGEYGLESKAGLLSSGNYSANPLRLAAGYLKEALHHRAKIYSPADVAHINYGVQKTHITLANGPVITTKYLVFATGYEVPDLLKSQPYSIASTWAFATSPQDLAADFPLIWQAADPYLYIRRTPDGRLICGGEDAEYADDDKRARQMPGKVKTLQRKLKKLMPQVRADAAYHWGGSFGETKTGLPLIGAVPGYDNTYAIMAFGGNGITFAQLGAELIRAHMDGREDPDADLFALR